ncbi:MAG: beta-ketoacyl-[acyl-carrier-protein] synthase family protein [Candidatus Pacebacteria bacterium]|nr:beta-ketoacyl-[acyl-carrier-protein] synthase family protein [Candidatus Paceibacterota bacterium]
MNGVRRRVVITGMGLVTPIGNTVGEFWEGLLNGRCGIGPITHFDASAYPCTIAAEVKDFKTSDYFERKRARHLARGTQFGVAAALDCLKHANWPRHTNGDTHRLGISAGIGNSPQDAVEQAVMQLRDHGYRRALGYNLRKSVPHSMASEAAYRTGFRSTVMTFSTACASGINALGYAAEEIRSNRLDAMLCVAADANITKYTFGYFCKAGMLSRRNNDPARASRPFDAKRDGGILGEGGASVLLEEYESAKRRGADIYAEILGFGCSGLGYHHEDFEESTPAGMAAAIGEALAAANCGPPAIDYIGAHGVSDPRLDAWETKAFKEVFGDRAYDIPISSIKALTGIPQTATGILQLIAGILAINHGVLPPTMNYEYPDPECDLDYIPNEPRHNRIRRALTLMHGFNGTDAAVVVGGIP